MLIVKYWSMFRLCAPLKVSLVYLSIFLITSEFQTSSSVGSPHPRLTSFLPSSVYSSLTVSAFFFKCPVCLPSLLLPLCSSHRRGSPFQIQSRWGGCAEQRCWSFLRSRTYSSFSRLIDLTCEEKSYSVSLMVAQVNIVPSVNQEKYKQLSTFKIDFVLTFSFY